MMGQGDYIISSISGGLSVADTDVMQAILEAPISVARSYSSGTRTSTDRPISYADIAAWEGDWRMLVLNPQRMQYSVDKLYDIGIPVYSPTVLRKVVRTDRTTGRQHSRIDTARLFGGYAFGCAPHESMWPDHYRDFSIVQMSELSRSYQPILRQELASIEMEIGRNPYLGMENGIGKGTLVRVLSGGMYGAIGRIEYVDEQGWLHIAVTILGRSVPTKLEPPFEVEPI